MYDYTLLAVPDMFASGVGATLDLLASAARLARVQGYAAPTWRVVSDEPRVTLSNGLGVDATPLPGPDRSIWIVPGLCLADETSPKTLRERACYRHPIEALKAHASSGGTIAASCSAVFLLEAAGLLARRRATTTWWLGGLLKTLAPTCAIDINKMVVDDGTIVTAGAAFAHLDLMLHLLRSRLSPTLADAVSREMVLDGRQSQAKFVLPAALAGGNDLAGRLVALFEAALPHPPSIEELAAKLGISSRTLLRHIKSSTGRSASALLQSVRINRARMLLETSNLSVEEIAAQVGYADTTALRRLMRRVAQATPRQFRASV